jgi:hypothetical protein
MPLASPRNLTLVVPGLFGATRRFDISASADSELRLPALETFLARADHHAQAGQGTEARVFALFGVEPEEGADSPVAAVTRVLDLGIIDNGWWLRADPVHLVPDRDRLVLHDSQSFDLTQDEATRLAAELGESYAADGWILKAPRPGRWYLKPPLAPRLSTTPLPEVVGRDIHPYLPQGRDGKAWRTLLNELQILLHTAQVNGEREQAGKPPVNSLWFWGGGRLPKVRPAKWSQVWSLEPVSLGLARLCEIPVAAPAASFLAWQRQAATQSGDAHLVVLDDARASLQYGDRARWQEVIRRLEGDWFVPMLAALGSRQLQSLTLLDETGPAYELTPRGARRWWRWRRRVAQYAVHA